MSQLSAGQRTRHWRELRGMSQVDFAAKLKWDKTKLCRVEKGRQEPDAAEVELIAETLGLTMPEFYGAIDEKPATRKARAS